jgi:uncharacterized membrane protein
MNRIVLRALPSLPLLIVSLALAWPGSPRALASSDRGPTRVAPKITRFEVRGLPDWDRLKMRLAPGLASPAVGEIPARAGGVLGTGRRRHVGRALWREVEYQGVRGWVHGKFIRREASNAAPPITTSPGDRADVFIEDLVCVGHAPAWKLVVDRDGSTAGRTALGAVLTDVHALAAQLQKGPSAKTAARTWSMTLEDAQGVGVATLTLREQRCTAGNGSEIYGYEVSTHNPDGTVLAGCCNRRDVPPIAQRP